MITQKVGGFGQYRFDDGNPRPFDPDSDGPRMVIAVVLAKREGWAEIRPGTWAEAGAVAKALKDRDMIRPKRERRPS